MLATESPPSRLKFVLERMVAGGTPASGNPVFWADSDGTPWVSIGDMTGSDVVMRTARSVTDVGIDAARLEVLPDGTLLFAMYASLGTSAFLGVKAATNQAILGLIPSKSRADGRFLRYWLAALQPHLRLYSRSNTQDNLNAEVVGNLRFPQLDVGKQVVVADFLDRETARIDELVDKKIRLTSLLEEKRTSAIVQAVTKGLDPSVRMKDLGIPWLGEIPAHWERRPLKSLVDFRKGKDAQRITAEFIGANLGPYPVFSGQTENAGLMGSIDSYDFDAPEGVILVTTVGKVGTTRILDGRFSLSQNCALMTPKTDDVNLRFLRYQLDPLFSYEASRVPMSAGRWSLRIEDLRTYRVYLPGAEEQKSVAAHLDGVTEHIDHTTALISKQVELLAEYRQALISAAVTGQIDVAVSSSEPEEAIG